MNPSVVALDQVEVTVFAFAVVIAKIITCCTVLVLALITEIGLVNRVCEAEFGPKKKKFTCHDCPSGKNNRLLRRYIKASANYFRLARTLALLHKGRERHRTLPDDVAPGHQTSERTCPMVDDHIPSAEDSINSDAGMPQRGDERQPFWGHCASCKHQWVIFYAPLDLAKVAEIGKRAICPACGETKVNCGKAQ
jgi:hypothetical protein